MRYKIEELEKMSEDDLIKVYRDSKTSLKKDILTKLANSRKFAVLMSQLDPKELIAMAKIHPYKEVVVDTMIDEMESHGVKMSRYLTLDYSQSYQIFQRENFNIFMDTLLDTLQHKSFFAKIKETLTRKPALPEALPKKIEQAKKLCEIEVRRNHATGKKMEELETKGLDQAVDESRVEVNNGEMAKMFDRYAKEARKEGRFFGLHGVETEIAYKVKAQLTEEYMATLGSGKEDVARLVAMKEFENYSGQRLYVPYFGRKCCSKRLFF